LIMITDLTETRLLQDKLGQLQRLSSLGRMVSKLAHQIRTPLSAAMLYGANLRNKKLTQEARVNFQDKLMLRLHDLEQQVNDMLLFAKSGSKAVVEPVNINQLIEQAKQVIEPQVSQAGAKVNLNFCQQGGEVLGNVSALSGAIQNLIHNSLSVIKVNAVINISAYCQDEYAYISVRDNGPGISGELANKIFEPFYTSRSQGTGLGLAVVKSVTNAHQGEVNLLSQPGEGAHFCMKIPLLVSEEINAALTEHENATFLSKELSHEHK
jgi:two-component system sensor histidine kinase FlrB